MAITGTYQNKDLKKYKVWEITNPSDTITIKAKTDIDAMMHFLRIYNPNDGTLDDVEAELIEEPKVKTFGELTIYDKIYEVRHNSELIKDYKIDVLKVYSEQFECNFGTGNRLKCHVTATEYVVSVGNLIYFTNKEDAEYYIANRFNFKEQEQSDEKTLKELYKEMNTIIDKIAQITNKD